MSLNIDVEKVRSVLIANTWHDVDGDSFDLDSYEFHHKGMPLHGGGQNGICATGFSFSSGGAWIAGPLTAVQAVSYKAMAKRKPTAKRKP